MLLPSELELVHNLLGRSEAVPVPKDLGEFAMDQLGPAVEVLTVHPFPGRDADKKTSHQHDQEQDYGQVQSLSHPRKPVA